MPHRFDYEPEEEYEVKRMNNFISNTDVFANNAVSTHAYAYASNDNILHKRDIEMAFESKSRTGLSSNVELDENEDSKYYENSIGHNNNSYVNVAVVEEDGNVSYYQTRGGFSINSDEELKKQANDELVEPPVDNASFQDLIQHRIQHQLQTMSELEKLQQRLAFEAQNNFED